MANQCVESQHIDFWFLDQLWSIDGQNLTNKGIWQSNDKWNFKNYSDDTMIYIENMSKNKVLGVISIDDEVIEEPMVKCKLGQLWQKGNPDKEGSFTIRNFESRMILTAISTNRLAIKGNKK